MILFVLSYGSETWKIPEQINVLQNRCLRKMLDGLIKCLIKTSSKNKYDKSELNDFTKEVKLD